MVIATQPHVAAHLLDGVDEAAAAGGIEAPHLARLPAADLIDLARSEFRDLIGARGDPAVARVRHWPMGLPQYRIGHPERAACLRSAGDRQPGLFVTGNYLDGPSVGACLDLARETAAAVHEVIAGSEVTSSAENVAV